MGIYLLDTAKKNCMIVIALPPTMPRPIQSKYRSTLKLLRQSTLRVLFFEETKNTITRL